MRRRNQEARIRDFIWEAAVNRQTLEDFRKIVPQRELHSVSFPFYVPNCSELFPARFNVYNESVDQKFRKSLKDVFSMRCGIQGRVKTLEFRTILDAS